MILIVGSDDDLHVKKVVSHLNDLSEAYQIFDPKKFGTGVFSSMYLQGERVTSNFNEFSILDFKSVWLRRSELHNTEIIFQEGYFNFANRESTQFLSSLGIWSEEKIKWVNKPLSNYKAQLKPVNLAAAANIGFSIPNTYYGNNPFDIFDYIKPDKYYAVKAAYHGYLPVIQPYKIENRAIYTQKILGQSLLDNIEQIAVCPICIQEYIEKDFELRITVVGSKVFACKIYSQQAKNPDTHVDWRHYDKENTPHEAFELPQEIQSKCIELLSVLDLTMGCIDMIVDPKGEYYYLEINPKGQWYWIEELTGMKITEALALELAN